LFSKTAIYLSIGLHKVHPSYRRSLQLSKEAIQHFKRLTLNQDPDPLTQLNPDPIRIRNPAAIHPFSETNEITF
jgi:hypothetical protein